MNTCNIESTNLPNHLKIRDCLKFLKAFKCICNTFNTLHHATVLWSLTTCITLASKLFVFHVLGVPDSRNA